MISRNRVAVKVQNRSGFDKSHFHLLTGTTGTLIPIMVDEVMGNTKVHLKLNLAASMPPLAADTYMKTDVCVEAFFVPHRLCYGGFEQWYCDRVDNVLSDTATPPYSAHSFLPIIQCAYGDDVNLFYHNGARSLLDYLGFSSSMYMGGSSIFNLNPLPMLAYHLIWDHYYRVPTVQKSCFARANCFSSVDQADPYFVSVLPSVIIDSAAAAVIPSQSNTNPNTTASFLLADGVSLLDTRKRNFGFDYFTNAFPNANLNGVSYDVDTSGGDFSISALRAANSLTQFMEKNQLAGARYQDTLMARTGASIKDGVASRPVLLGAAKYNAYNKSMLISADNASSGSGNPFAVTAGAVQGNMYAVGSDLLIDGFEAKEPGIIMVLASLVPTVSYSTGCERILTRYRSIASQIVDMADPILQNTGNQPIYQYELNGNIGTTDVGAAVFGYTDKFADWMIKRDRISGLFRVNMSLENFVSQRYFAAASTPTINSSFLEIPSDYLDNVTIVGAGSGQRYGYWLECAFDYKISQPLAQYSIPSLQDPAYEHGQTVVLHRGGFRF